jgi:hypothetical protein
MLDPDPDKWPVVAWRRQIRYGDFRWALFDCGMVGFLVKMMRAEFDVCPLGDTSLWGATAPSCTGVSSSAAGLRALIPKRASLIRTCRTSSVARVLTKELANLLISQVGKGSLSGNGRPACVRARLELRFQSACCSEH